LGRPEDKDPYTATIVPVGGNLPVRWWSDGGNHTNWVRVIGDGHLIKIWNDRLDPGDTRIWVEIYTDPTQPPILRQECYILGQCYLYSARNQVYYIRGQIMTGVGCSYWNIDDP
jgi:hypothetical protein